ncbi:MAG: type II toxin-antitoxin system VapC family toxin [Dehalococcoidia bacterium]
MRYLLDTNVISELIAKHPNERVIQWLDQLDPTSIYLSVITVGELCKGIEKLTESSRKDELRNWLTDELLIRFQDRILVLDMDAMLTWGELVGRLERTGRPLAAIDSLIAALALANSCSLVTRNEADFRDTGLNVINPWK